MAKKSSFFGKQDAVKPPEEVQDAPAEEQVDPTPLEQAIEESKAVQIEENTGFECHPKFAKFKKGVK